MVLYQNFLPDAFRLENFFNSSKTPSALVPDIKSDYCLTVQEISDDDNDDDEEVDETEDETLSFTESLKMLDKINKCSFLDEESHKMLSTVTKKLENLQLQNKKQKSITSYFS